MFCNEFATNQEHSCSKKNNCSAIGLLVELLSSMRVFRVAFAPWFRHYAKLSLETFAKRLFSPPALLANAHLLVVINSALPPSREQSSPLNYLKYYSLTTLCN